MAPLPSKPSLGVHMRARRMTTDPWPVGDGQAAVAAELAEQIMALSVAFVPEPAPRRQATRARKRVVLSDECWQLLRWQLWFYGRHSGAATDAGSVLRRVPRLKLKPQDAFMDTRAARAAERLGTSAGSRREA
eukprot:CAMPEP_0179931498 /NCGR_PEP_ID=MMETSP0983-20121128/10695_1 /TAXON_ID=483367 /ORGANISM="non described non described, Strain CCMP 2436" /LENGTH=132 /DNA_ID=CAMNT_0021835897 /DNA_START=33 /DNA_END=430 /DNA_ORIENTATION=-